MDRSHAEDSKGTLDRREKTWKLCFFVHEPGYSIGQKAEGRITKEGRLGEDWESSREVCHTTRNRSNIKDVS